MMEKQFVKDLVSICIPTYNGAAYLRETIDSVLAQDYKDFEIIINDDCSKDNTKEVVESINDDRIKFYENKENKGLVGNWNETIQYANGEFTKLLCQDDILCEGAISKQVKLLTENKLARLSIGNTYVIDQNGKVTMNRARFKKDEYIEGKKYAKKSFRGRNIFAEPPNALYYTEDFYKIGKYDASFSYTPDWDYALRLAYLGPIAVTSNYIFKFRVSSNQETARLYREKKNQANLDTDAMLAKHVQLNEIKLSVFDQVVFKIVIRLFAIARSIVLKMGKA